ncbi:MAG: 50S ribosomal protein L25 [Actinomycetota bacterium]
MEISLDVQPRADRGKGPAGRARAVGKVPAVFYGPSVEPRALYVDARQMAQALHTEAGANVLLNLKLDGESHLAVPRQIHRHPVRGTLVHVDLFNVARNVKITADVPIHLVGHSHGVREGGQLDLFLHTLTVEALPTEIPDAIEVDVTELGIGDSMTVADIKVSSGVQILTEGEEILLSLHTEKVLEVEAESAADGAEAPKTDGGTAAASQAPADGSAGH